MRLTKENDYALIDAGCAEKPLVADIMAAVREATKDGKLRLLLRAPAMPLLLRPCMPACMPAAADALDAKFAVGSTAACRV